MRTVEGSSGVYAAAVVGWYVCVRSVKVIQYMIYGTREHMCCRDLQFQCCAAVSVFFYLSPGLVCIISTVAACWCVSMTQVLNTGFLLFYCNPIIALPLCMWIYACVCAHVCVSELFGWCVDSMGHHLMSMFLFIYG